MPTDDKPRTFAYICQYNDESDEEYYRQFKAINKSKPQPKYKLVDRVKNGKSVNNRTVKRTGLQMLMRGLLPGDIVVMTCIDRLGSTPKDIADGLLMLANNEIRLLDVDPDGDRDWRPGFEHLLGVLVRRQGDIPARAKKFSSRLHAGVLYRGVGWMSGIKFGGISNLFEPCEGPREVCRTIVRLHDDGMAFDAIADKLKAQGVLYVGVRPDLSEAFTAELAEECYLSAKQDFPYPTLVTRE